MKHLFTYPTESAALESGNFPDAGYVSKLIQDGTIKIKPPRVNKWINEIIVQEMTCNGWEDSCAEISWKDARSTVKDYRDNGISARIIKRRTLNPDYINSSFNVVVINKTTKQKTIMNSTPLTHDEACAMLSKLTRYDWRTEKIEIILK